MCARWTILASFGPIRITRQLNIETRQKQLLRERSHWKLLTWGSDRQTSRYSRAFTINRRVSTAQNSPFGSPDHTNDSNGIHRKQSRSQFDPPLSHTAFVVACGIRRVYASFRAWWQFQRCPERLKSSQILASRSDTRSQADGVRWTLPIQTPCARAPSHIFEQVPARVFMESNCKWSARLFFQKMLHLGSRVLRRQSGA